jgi:hypothetical protein
VVFEMDVRRDRSLEADAPISPEEDIPKGITVF